MFVNNSETQITPSTIEITPDAGFFYVENSGIKILVPLSRRLKCHLCDFECAGKESSGCISNTLTRHLSAKHNIILQKPPYRCRFCGWENDPSLTYNRRFVEQHVKKSHPNNTFEPELLLPFPCLSEGCGLSFASRRGLGMHSKVHTREKVQFVKDDILSLVPRSKKQIIETTSSLHKKSLITEISSETKITNDVCIEEVINDNNLNDAQCVLDLLVEREQLTDLHLKRVKDNSKWLDDCTIFEYLIRTICSKKPGFIIVNPVVWNKGYTPAYWGDKKKSGTRLPTFPRFSMSWDSALIPTLINNNHWIIGVLSKRTKRVTIYDSLRNSLDKETNDKMTIIGELLLKRKPILQYAESNDYLIQTDNSSCGPIICMIGERIAFSKPLYFSMAEVYKWRAEAYAYLKETNSTVLSQNNFSFSSSLKKSISNDIATLLPKKSFTSQEEAKLSEDTVINLENLKENLNLCAKKTVVFQPVTKVSDTKKKLDIVKWTKEIILKWNFLNGSWNDFETICSDFIKIVHLSRKAKWDKAAVVAESCICSLKNSSDNKQRTVGTQTESNMFKKHFNPITQKKHYFNKKEEDNSSISRLYFTNKKSAIKKILEGENTKCISPLPLVEKFFQNQSTKKGLNADNLTVLLNEIFSSDIYEEIELCRPITEKDVEEIFKTTKRSAPGWDKISYTDLKVTDPTFEALTLIYNICLREEKIPEAWKMSDTVLIYKKGNPENLSNWRPISLQLTIYKLYSAILARRILGLPNLISKEQRGFGKYDGCSDNIQMLTSVLNDAKNSRKSISVAFLDLSNAFGSMPHSLIYLMMEKLGLPKKLINIVRNIYWGSTMSVKTDSGKTSPISIQAGVKQGDPLSPILFNIGLELLIRLVKNKFSGYGYKHGNLKVNILAYADDLAITTCSADKLQHELNNIVQIAKIMGLKFNPGKCAILSLKSNSISTDSIFIDRFPIRSLKWDEHYSYLGFEVGAILRRSPKAQIIKSVKDVLDIKDSGLMPSQKIDAIRTFIMPRFSFICHNTSPYVSDFKSLDRAIALTAKQVCNLPIFGTSRLLIHGSVSKGGLGILRSVDEYYLHSISGVFNLLSHPEKELRDLTFYNLTRSVNRWLGRSPENEDLSKFLNVCEDTDFKVLARQTGEYANLFTRYRKAVRYFAGMSIFINIDLTKSPILRIDCPLTSQILSFQTYQKKSVYSSLRRMILDNNCAKLATEYPYQGRIMKVIASNNLNNKFTQDNKFCSAKGFRFIHRARLGLLPLGGTPMGKHTGLAPVCRRCKLETETLSHVLGCCPFNKTGIVAKHNLILDLIYNEIIGKGLKKGLVLNKEAPIRIEGKNFIPDLVLINKEKKCVRIIDVACTNEAYDGLVETRNRKVLKYRPVQLFYESMGFTANVEGIVVGNLGCWPSLNDSVLNSLFISKRRFATIARKSIQICINESRNIYVTHTSFN